MTEHGPIRYAAIGDSFTEGVGDELPDGTTRGWADRVAQGLAAERDVEYVNLAIRGRKLDDIATNQFQAALALSPRPTILTVNGGGNDMLRFGTDIDALIAMTRETITAGIAHGMQVVALSGADPSSRLPFGSTIRRRGEELTSRLEAIAAETGATFVNVFSDKEIQRPGYWSPDRLHLNPIGHQRVADLVLNALGYERETSTLESHPNAASIPSVGSTVGFVREHLVPWVGRRVTGRSSGDNRQPKFATWAAAPTAG